MSTSSQAKHLILCLSDFMDFILDVTRFVCVRLRVCVSEHNVPSIHSSLLLKPDGAHQSESRSRTTQRHFWMR